jgi:hypothetical protein
LAIFPYKKSRFIFSPKTDFRIQGESAIVLKRKLRSLKCEFGSSSGKLGLPQGGASVQESVSWVAARPIKGTAVEIQAVYNARRKRTTIEQLAEGKYSMFAKIRPGLTIQLKYGLLRLLNHDFLTRILQLSCNLKLSDKTKWS